MDRSAKGKPENRSHSWFDRIAHLATQQAVCGATGVAEARGFGMPNAIDLGNHMR